MENIINTENLPSSVSNEEFASAIYYFPYALHIVATDGTAGKRAITISACMPISFTPPALMVCLRKSAPENLIFIKNKVFTVNTLSKDHEDLVFLFGGSTNASQEERFKSTHWTSLKTGSPALKESFISFDCVIEKYYDHDTHFIIVARVVDIHKFNTEVKEPKALIYSQKQILSL